MNDADVRGQLEQEILVLARSNRELEEFAYVASHDLKSPLLVVSGFLELLQATKGDQLDDDARLYIDAARRGVSRMEQLIDGLLTYSRIGRIEPDREWVDLGVVVAEALSDAAQLIRHTQAHVLVGPLPRVVGNRVLLAQVLQNLVNNAAKFHRPGVAPTIVVDAVEGNGEWTIRVTDDGVGVPVEHRDQVFVMFKRLAQTSDVPGSGIGLAICHRAVLAHGGRIWFDDVDGEGARVCFSVPG